MIPATLARRYARALLQLADTPMQREIFGRDLAAFVRSAAAPVEGAASLLAVLDFKLHAESQRRLVLESVLKRMNLDVTVNRFIQLVFERGRVAGLPQILGAFQDMADSLAGRQKASITSARCVSCVVTSTRRSATSRRTARSCRASSRRTRCASSTRSRTSR